jgi:hypothetical protein
LTGLADENLLRFGLGDKAHIEKFDRTAPRKKRAKKNRSSAPVNPPGLAAATAAAFPASP